MTANRQYGGICSNTKFSNKNRFQSWVSVLVVFIMHVQCDNYNIGMVECNDIASHIRKRVGNDLSWQYLWNGSLLTIQNSNISFLQFVVVFPLELIAKDIFWVQHIVPTYSNNHFFEVELFICICHLYSSEVNVTWLYF